MQACHTRALRHRLAAVALTMLAILTPGAARAQGPDTLMFGTTHEPTSTVYQYATDYLQQLCAEIRQRCALQSLPGRRSTAMLAAGALAGEVGRVREYQHQHPEYRRVDEPFVTTRTYIFTRPGQPPIDNWEALARQARSVSYKRGIYFYQTKLESMRPRLQPHDVQTVPACLQMVLTGRDDACVFDDGSLTDDARAMLPRGQTGKPLDDLPLYIYVGKDHAVLADTMTEAAKKLTARGLKTELRQKHFGVRSANRTRALQ